MMEPEEVISFCQSDLPSASFAVFEDMRTKQELCDIKMNIGDSVFEVHRVILAAGIPYFRSVFTSSSLVSGGNEITMVDMDSAVLESLIQFAYTSRINISTQNAQSLLRASEFLQISQVKDACVEFLRERLGVNNVSEVRTFALDINNTELIESTTIYIRQHFEVFCKSEDFLRLSHSCIKKIISGDDLRISREESVFEAVMKWIKFSPSKRGNFLPELLGEVRMVHLNTGYLIKRVASEELVRLSIPCRDLIQNVQSYHVLPKEESSFLNLKIQPRTCGYTMKGIYAVCRSKSLGYRAYYCDLINCTWNSVKSDKLQLRDRLFDVVAINNSIYLFFQGTIAKFHLKELEWEILKSIHKAISGAAFVSHENLIYCFGSSDRSFQNRLRCFDTYMNNWLKEGTMTTGRSFCAAASLGESVYVTGGIGSSYACINTVDNYNTATKGWSESTPMLYPRECHACASLNGKIYVCGGLNGSTSINTGEVFDSQTNKWTFISPNITVKGQCSLIPHNNKIFAFSRAYGSNSVEIYDDENGKWRKLSFSMPSAFLNAVLISVT